MALVKGALGGSAASGKMGGQVFARNRAGQYSRAWAKPVNPMSVAQTAIRGMFGGASAGWGGLAAGDVNAWDGYAALLTRLNRLGEPYTPKGRQIYMETAQNLSLIALPALTTPSAYTDNPAITSADTATVTTTGGTITAVGLDNIIATIPSADVDSAIIVQATPSHPAKLTNVNNLFRSIGHFKYGDQPYVGASDYTAVFGTTAEVGSIVVFRMRVVDATSGLGSSWYYIKAAVTGT